MKKLLFLAAMLMLSVAATHAQTGKKLSGTVIGTATSVDYGTNLASTTMNTREMAFDDNLNTYFASYDRSYTWVGLDLGKPHVITRLGWSPARRHRGDERILLGVFEGANTPDFMDAIPLYIIKEKGISGKLSYTDVKCSKGFRYVRYVGPDDERCNIAELEFYGYPGVGDETSLPRLTNLPTVSIQTENGVIPYDKKHQINAIITIVSEDGKQLLCDSGTVRLRGNGSLTFPKKPYRIKFNKKTRVLNSPGKAKKWVLINNYGDKTLLRNQLAFELSRCMNMPFTPYIQPVDVVLNGEYKGSYQLCDHVDVRKHRVNIEEMTPEDNSGVPLTGGYLVEIDARAPSEPSWFYSAKGLPVTIHYPDDDEITTEQHDYIESYFNKMEADWEKYLDTNTFLRHFLVGEMSGNTDTYYSVFMYKHRDNDTLFTGPVWDFDLAFDNDRRTYPVNKKTDFVYRSGGSVVNSQMRLFVDNIAVHNKKAREKMVEIWDEARHNGITKEHLLEVINEEAAYLQESQKLNFMRWPVMDTLVHQNPVVWGSYDAEVQNVRRFIEERLNWMDRKLGYTYVPEGIADTPADYAQDTRIYNLSGQPCGDDLRQLPKGIYIVRQKGNTRKIHIH